MRVEIAVKRAAVNPIWYNDTAIIVIEISGMVGQTAESVAVKTEGAIGGFS
jgi:hypothetical protein